MRYPAVILSSSIILSSSALLTSQSATAGDTVEKIGSALAVTIPAAAFGSTYYMDDKEGRQQFYYAFAANAAATQALKMAVDKERPNGRDNRSFPSQHTSLAFQGASFIHKRYGFEYSIPAYLGAGFVAYSRVAADEHDTVDVLAGAALGVASSSLLTKRYEDGAMISANLAPDYYGVTLYYPF